jgi:hypothetical protein
LEIKTDSSDSLTDRKKIPNPQLMGCLLAHEKKEQESSTEEAHKQKKVEKLKG